MNAWPEPQDEEAPRPGARVAAQPSFTGYPFALGVASGQPSPTGVVLWTRLAVEPLRAGGGIDPVPVAVGWEVAEDERFARVVARGTAEARPQAAHSVHVEPAGLQPARWYFYRFTAGSEASPVGRTRTSPAATDAAPLRLALASCQSFEDGYFGAHRQLAAEDLQLMVFVGDYIYEGTRRTGGVRRHAGGTARTLDGYRIRHAQYKADRDLQRLHAAVPWVPTWDDHEVANNYAGLRSGDLDPQFARRRAAAYRAYYEHMPLRSWSRPSASGMRIRSRRDFGALVRLHALDTRQHRTPQACPRPGRGGANAIDERCRELHQPGRTMLGTRQEGWLDAGLAEDPARWHLIAQQTLMAPSGVVADGRRRFSSDQWDGYPDARGRLLRRLADGGVRSAVVLSGDAHVGYVCDLADPAGGPVVATELCGPSLTSRAPARGRVEAVLRDNPHIRYGDPRHGYVVLDVTAGSCTAAYRVIGDPADPATGVETAATFAIEAGRPGAQPA
jgi:alkaline phosphatase D